VDSVIAYARGNRIQVHYRVSFCNDIRVFLTKGIATWRTNILLS